jgi:Domain of unknown function (DUF4288)
MSENWISEEARDALWFSAKLRFELTREISQKREYEDRVYLFHCPNPESAATRAVDIGKQQEHEYKTDAGEQLKWRFVDVLKVMMTFLDTPLDRGIEVYSEKAPAPDGISMSAL